MDTKKYTTREVKRMVREYAHHLQDEHGVPIRRVVLFGSYAKKTARPWSDIDVCIVSPIFSKEDRLTYLWRRRRPEDVDAMIAPVGFAPSDFTDAPLSPLVHDIVATGVEVSL